MPSEVTLEYDPRSGKCTFSICRPSRPQHYFRCMKRDEIIATFRAYEVELRAAGVTRFALFGSVARNEAQRGANIDLIAAFDAGREFSLLDTLDIENRLTDLIGHPVDLVEEESLGRVWGKKWTARLCVPSDPIQRFSDVVENIERIERDPAPLKAACSGPRQILKSADQSR